MGYLTHTDPNAFLDMEVGEKADYMKDYILCPKCKGHGGWNLRIDAYGKGKHFRCSCGQCNGWGYVHPDSTSATCIHDFVGVSEDECNRRGITHHGRCWHVYECKHCGQITSHDSSD